MNLDLTDDETGALERLLSVAIDRDRYPSEEDRRRITRERAKLLQERIRHTNRIRGLLFGQGITNYNPLHKNRRKGLEELRTGDGRSAPAHLKSEILREIDRLELVLRQIGEVEAERDEMLQLAQASSPAALLMRLKGIGPEFATVSTLRVYSASLGTDGSWRPMPAWLPVHGRVAASTKNRVSRRPVIRVCAPQWSSLLGCG